MIPLASAVFCQYLSIALLAQPLDANIDALEITSLRWDVLRGVLLLGPDMEGLVGEVIARLYHVWRLSPSQCAEYQAEEKLVSFLAYSTTLKGFETIIDIIYSQGKDSPILQAIAMSLTFNDMVSRSSMAGAYSQKKLDYMLRKSYVALDRPILFKVGVKDVEHKTGPQELVLYPRATDKNSSWEGKRIARFSDTFTMYLVNQLPEQHTEEGDGQFQELLGFLERGAPLPSSTAESMTISTVHSVYRAMLRAWNQDQRKTLLNELVRRRVHFRSIPEDYQSTFVGLIIEELRSKKSSPHGDDLGYYTNLAPLVSMKGIIPGFSAKARWTLLVGFFQYEESLSGFLLSLFNSGVRRLSDYTRVEVNSALRSSPMEDTKGVAGTELIQSWDQIVSEFARLVTPSSNMIHLWLPKGKRCDLALSLFLWALHASNEQVHPLVTYLIRERNVNWNDAFVFSSGGGGGLPQHTVQSYQSSILQAWFDSIPEKEQKSLSYWPNHKAVLRLCIGQRDVHLPRPDQGRAPARDFGFIVQAFVERLAELWNLLYDRREPISHVSANLRGAYKIFCINAALSNRIELSPEPDFERLTDLEIYPDDKYIKERDDSHDTGAEKMSIQYLKAIAPSKTIWFRKFLQVASKRDKLFAQLKELRGSDREFGMALTEWERSRTSVSRSSWDSSVDSEIE